MAFFSELEDILTASTNKILTNQNICKLLSYYSDTMDLRYDPLVQPPIEDIDSLLLTRVFPLPKTPDAQTEQICFVDINIAGGEPTNKNSGFAKVDLVFDIICHLDSWFIKGGFRPLKVLSEIDAMFNNQLLPEIPIGNKPQLVHISPKNYANKFYGYQVCYQLTVNSNIECG